jgi:predicted DNA-binding transcriptional regulator AlpA
VPLAIYFYFKNKNTLHLTPLQYGIQLEVFFMSIHQQTTALKGFYRMSQLATTAARKERKYIAKDGTTRIIKARPERQGLLPMGETTIWDKVRAGEFPTPIKLTERITAWRIEDIEAWMASRELKP